MGADHDIDRSVGESFEGLFDFGGAAKAIEEVNGDRELRHAGAEIAMVLLGENGGGAKHGYLAASGDGFEGRADGDFCFSKTDIAADEPVHGLSAPCRLWWRRWS